MIGRVLCWLGLHQPLITHPGVCADGYWRSAVGFCARDGCRKTYQYDL